MNNMYVKWDDGEVTFGPSEKPQFSNMTNDEVADAGWYRVETSYEHVSYPEITEYDDKFHVFVDYLYEFNEDNNTVSETKYIDFIDTNFIKRKISNKINGYRDEYISNTVEFGGVSFDTDEKSRELLTGALSAVSTQMMLSQTMPEYTPSPIPWTINSNDVVLMLPEELINLSLTLAGFVSTCYGLARYHKDQILALDNPSDIIAYDFSVNWPDRNLGGTIEALS